MLFPIINILFSSQLLIGKKNPFGIVQLRYLILTDVPSLLYADPSSNKDTPNGQIEWDASSPPEARKVDATSFEIKTAKRVYKFFIQKEDTSVSVDEWVNCVNDAARKL